MIGYRSIADLDATIRRNLFKIPSDVDLVVGIPRSGMLAASMLALHRNLPLVDLEGYLTGRNPGHGLRALGAPDGSAGKRALILDDSVNSGTQMREVKRQVAAAGLGQETLYAAVYVKPSRIGEVDICFEELEAPRCFEWNIMHSGIMKDSCIDFDGILCRDPSAAENDDGPRYIEFLRTAEPLCLPSVPVGWIVTSRLEKYRDLTLGWLEKHGVTFGELVMLDLPTKADRMALNAHAPFKAEVYQRAGARMFVESSRRQAAEIAALTERPVYCLETATMFYGHAPVVASSPRLLWLKRIAKRTLQYCGVRV